jgi:hypothetical protein
MLEGGVPHKMVRGGVSIRRSTDPATDGVTDDRIRHGGGNTDGNFILT